MSESIVNARQQHFLVVDDHDVILQGTIPALQAQYPNAQVSTAKNVQAAEQKLIQYSPDLVIVDLSLPETAHTAPETEVGIQFLRRLICSTLAPNILVISTNIKPIILIKPLINAYEGGFVAMDKSLPISKMVEAIAVALQGSIYLPPEVRARPEFDQKWLELLKLKYQEGLSDKAIAAAMGISDRTVRNYWVRIQDALNVHEDPDKDLRMQIQLAARRAGLITWR